MILMKSPKSVGIYRLTMKSGSDNFRASAIFDIINNLKFSDISIIIYEPTLNKDIYEDMRVINDLDEFKNNSDVILANRYNKELDDIKDKVYTRDLYYRD